MQFIGSVFGVFSIITMFITFLPLLGRINWGVIPFAIAGLVISSIGVATARKSSRLGVAAIVPCSVVIVVRAFRLNLGGRLF
jgi:hypothetical protein